MKTALAALLLAAGAGAATAAPRPVLHIVRADTKSGLASSEPAETRNSGFVSDFRQREPNDGEPATVRTAAEVTFDDAKLYVTFVCEQDPASIRAHLSRRDDISGDDYVAISLDTFHDGRHAYVFKANPLGVQRDGIISEGQDDDFSFDALWESEGRLTSSGYIVRIGIPFRSLRYAAGAGSTWAIALSRYVPARAELSTWPRMTSAIDAYIPQFAALEGLQNLPAGQFATITPYAFASGERVATAAGNVVTSSALDRRAGLDAKVVVANDWTVDLTLQPDFSQVESDEPQVTTNQRYEVYFPEKRPFFTDRAGFFNTPEPLFFSRRVIDPLAGGRVTGTAGEWTMGALVVADRPRPDTSEALVTVARAQRAVRGESLIGATASYFDHGAAASNRVVSLDARVKLSPNWIVTAQATQSSTRPGPGDDSQTGSAVFGELRHEGRHLKYFTSFRDRSPDFAAPLGFVTRTDIRQIENSVAYYFRRERGALLSVIPTVSSTIDWDYAGRRQDASFDAPLWFDFKGPVSAAVGHRRAQEVYRGLSFRHEDTYATAYGNAFRWLGFDALVRRGTGINFYPVEGEAPSLGDAQYHSFGATLRPSARWLIGESYIVSRLARSGGGAQIFSDRYLRLKTSIQMSREWSVRAIIDRHDLAVDPGAAADTPGGRVTVDVLLTCLVHPGSAVYVGFTDRSEDMSLDPALSPQIRALGRISTGRQLFVKISRALQF